MEAPDWAIDRALGLLGDTTSYGNVDEVRHYAGEPMRNKYARQVLAFASYIAEHEEPPVDPLLVEAREIAAARPEHNSQRSFFRAGQYDKSLSVGLALAGLRRGIELSRTLDGSEKL